MRFMRIVGYTGESWMYRIEDHLTGEVVEHWGYSTKRGAKIAAAKFIRDYWVKEV